MTWSLGQTVRTGDVVCIPIVETVVSVTGGKARLAGHCEKRPALVLVFCDGEVSGLDMTGGCRDAHEIEGKFPGAIRQAQVRLHGTDD